MFLRLLTASPLRLFLFALGVSSVQACSEQDRPPSFPKESAEAPEDWLVDMTESSGLSFTHDSGIDGTFFMPQTLGSGGALFDYDEDGDLDLYLVTGGRGQNDGDGNRLFRQESGPRFVDVSSESGLGDPGFGMGAVLGDLDNDGDLDIVVTNVGADRIYRNDGDGSFSDITRQSGISAAEWSTSGSFFDYDRDGYLDLYIVTYVNVDPARTCRDDAGRPEFCPPRAFSGVPDRLYHNNRDGTFTDVSGETGIGSAVTKGLGIAVADFNADGWIDVFVANDGEKNDLWINLQGERFEERAITMGAAYNLSGKPEAGMGVALADVNGDLTLDLFLTHLSAETNTLYLQLRNGGLQDTTAVSGLGAPSLPFTGFGTAFTDLDLDGDPDLLIVNGRISRANIAGSFNETTGSDPLAIYRRYYPEPNAVLENLDGGKFQDACDRYDSFCHAGGVSRGLLIGDVDQDGDEDAVVTNSNGSASLFRNETPRLGNWLRVRAVYPNYARDAIGALVYVRAGGDEWVRPITHAYSYLVNGEAIGHFGIGPHEEVDAILIRWPDGELEHFPGAKANRLISVSRGTGADSP